jgi:glycosyltransferase involved in cell wall biosynthesis
VIDNCSTDEAVDKLPPRDANGALLRIFRNSSNIGRVGNWNRSIEIALELGFQYITYLFAGDCWLPDSGLREFLPLFRQYKAAIGFTPFVVSSDDGVTRRESRRFYVDGEVVVCSPASFLETLLESGLFPLGPLQANIYSISQQHRPWFKTTEPTTTDVVATFEFVHQSPSPVIIGSRPFLDWREYAGRFHMSMGPERTIEDYMNIFQMACKRVGLPINYGRAKARVVLNSLRLMVTDAPVRDWPRLLSIIARCAVRTPHRVSILHFFGTLWSRYARGRRLLQFVEGQ